MTVESAVEEAAPAEAAEPTPAAKKPRAKAAKTDEPDIEIIDDAKEETS